MKLSRLRYQTATWRSTLSWLHSLGLLLWLHNLVHATTAANRTLQLGVMLPYTGALTTGYGISGAVPLALDIIRTSDNFSALREFGYELNFSVADVDCDIGPGLDDFAKFYALADPPIDVYIGAPCDSLCSPMSHLMETVNSLMISYACVSPSLLMTDNYLGTGASYSDLASLMRNLMNKWGWTRLAIMAENDEVWLETAHIIMDDFAATGYMEAGIYQTNFVDMTVDETKLMHYRLNVFAEAVTFARVFFMLCYSDDIMEFVYVIKTLGLLNGDYAFITTHLSLEDSEWEVAEEEFGISISDVDGWIYITAYHRNFSDMVAFLEQVVNMSVSIPGFETDPLTIHEIDPMVYSLYDALILYATGVNACLSNGREDIIINKDGYNLSSKFMTNMHFEGISGRTYVTSYGSTMPRFSIIDVMNAKFVDIAVHTENGTEFLTSNILWPGGGFVPVLGRPVCGWNNEYCRKTAAVIIGTVILAGILLIIIVITLIVCRYRQKQSFILSMTWRISYDQLNFDVTASSRSLKMNTVYQSSSDERRYKKQLATDNKSCWYLHSRMLTVGSEGLLGSLDSLTELTQPDSHHMTSSVQPAYFDGQLVAVKTVQKPAVHLTKTLIAEVNQTRSLRHANINPVLGASVDPGKVCILSAYCSKNSLRDVLQSRHVTLDKIFTIAFATDIVQGMMYLHSSPVGYHGRLKSSNVLLDSRWTCKIADFGMREFRQGEARPFMGDTAYHYDLLWTAPELLRQRDAVTKYAGTQHGDVYSFAIILQEIATRKSPFEQGYSKPKEIIERVCAVEQPPFRPHVTIEEAGSPGIFDLMMSCWDEDPTLRPSFESIRDSLKRISRGKQTHIVDQMIYMLEKHSAHLEELVQDRTKQLAEEQKKTDELLGRMLPRSVADALKLGLVVEPEHYASVTISFSDIVGFTAMAASSTPLQVVAFLNDLYTCFDNVIEKFDAYKVETIGDAYMVASGVPVRNGNRHAGEIAMLALELLSEIRTFRIRHLADKQLQLRLGVHSGPVVAGVVGVKMPRYCLFGDTVNTASRMESSGLALRIHISPETKELLDELTGYHVIERGPIAMKGKGEIMTYFLLGKVGFHKTLPDLSLAAPLHEHEFK